MANKEKKMNRRVNRRLKRTVMGTLSAVFMLSAIIVALIPVPESRADTVALQASLIPNATADPNVYIPDYVGNNYEIFASGDGNFRVAYGSNGGTMTGVVNYYNINNVINNSTLTVPSAIEAFLYHKDREEYVAVNKDREYLYYFSQEEADETYNEDGTIATPALNAILSPCTANTQADWADKPLYVVDGQNATGNVELVSGNTISYRESPQLVIDVQYVGSVRYEVELNLLNNGGDVDGVYVTEDNNPDNDAQGVFEGATNFANLVVPERILAIGNNAFKGCQMQSVKVENGVNSIGNHAFENCNQLTTLNFSEPSNLKEIGDYAFAGCTYLTSVKIPDQVQKLGNCCFKDCTNLSAININGVNSDGNTSLTTIGSGLFYNCYSLTQVVFPDKITNIDTAQFLCYGCSSMTYLGLPDNAGSGDHIFKYNNVTGCHSLDTVEVPARDLKIDCKDADYSGNGFEDIYTGGARDAFGSENLGENSAFEEAYEISDEFCIMAYSKSYAHTYTQKHDIAFGYLDAGYVGWFEKMVDGYAFRVDESNILVDFEKVDPNNDGKNVIIPDNIAKYHVASIGYDTFSGNTDIQYIYIPASVSVIDAGAFKGCTSLRTVNFDDAHAVQEIGKDAFKTGVELADVDKDGDNVPEETLCFVGDISSSCVPFEYAMNVENNFNSPSSPTQYITYASQFPQNLQIQMVVEKNPNTNQIDSAYPVVVAIPTEEQLKGGGNPSYSLSTYTGNSDYVRTKEEENAIVASAYQKYVSNMADPANAIALTEEEQAVIDAVYHVHILDGIRGLKDDLFRNNEAVQSVILETVEQVPAGEFTGCTNLNTFIMNSSGAEEGESIGERAFEDCTNLVDVSLPDTLTEIKSIPFVGCSKLTEVDFNNSSNFTCQDGIIKGLDAQGNMGRIVECLQTRGLLVGAARLGSGDFAGITQIDEAAFQNCLGIREAYLDDAQLTIIPDYCFDGDTGLFYCSLPNTAKKIGKYAFRNTSLSTAVIPGNVQSIDDTAFVTEDGNGVQKYIQGLTIECVEDSTAYWYCSDKDGITAQTYAQTYTVTFLDWDGYEIAVQTVKKGASAEAPRTYREGYALTGWTKDFTNVKEDIVTQAIYEKSNAPAIDGFYSVVFQDFDGLYTWDTQYLKEGAYPTKPDVTPTRKGYLFSYWSPSNYTSIGVTGNLIIKAYYVEDPNADENGGSGGNTGGNGDNTGGSGNNNGGSTGGSGSDDSVKKYTVNFVDHDGTVLDSQIVVEGSCPTATTVVPTRKGYTFTTWSPSNYATVPVTGDMTIKALYKKGSGNEDPNDYSGDISSDSSNDGGGSSSNNNNNSGNTGNGNQNGNTGNTQTQTGNANVSTGTGGGNTTSGTVSSNASNSGSNTNKGNNNSGTKVVVTKSGISNRDLVSAVVSGANDNFVVKITDSEAARSEVEKALLAEYGSLDNLKFFAMDISLYDSTGTTKIENTTGITVNITLPLPDALAGYAGNNKAGAVKNSTFEKLNSRLITIDGIPCISFDAKHFSPYAIYVETNNLTSGVVDSTPTTGDPIHPKWFLSIGLALISVLLFFGKGSKNKIVKVIE